MSTLAGLACHRAGSGAPMLLLHGAGHRRQMWQPIIERLSGPFDVLAVDLPGFGESAALPSGQPPTPSRLADTLESVMNEAGWTTAHLVGNSLGGWLALELGARGRARSVTALMPAGLWRPGHGSDSRRHRALFAWWQALANLPGAPAAVRNPVLRTVALAGAFGRPWRIPPAIATGDVRNLRSSDMAGTMRALGGTRFTDGRGITVPLTVVLGSRDPLIRRRDLDLAQLPPHARVITLRGIGHVPTWDDPDAIASTITETVRSPSPNGSAATKRSTPRG